MARPKSYLIDMDGVLVRGAQPIPGANEFLARLQSAGAKFLVLTNNSLYTPRDLHARLQRIGLQLPPDAIYTSAMATAQFLASQHPHGSAFVVGEAGLTTALHDIGYIITDQQPDYVVLGETTAYSFERLTLAMRLVAAGARFIATNPGADGERPRARHRCGRRDDRLGHRRYALLYRQAQPADYADCPADPRCPLRGIDYGRRPDGHRHYRGHRERPGDHPGAFWRDAARGRGPLPLPPDPYRRVGRRYRRRHC
jgi:HAD superfamily hydrolase (TIGR01450 family)